MNENNDIKVGDKIRRPAVYRGRLIPVIEWTVHKENPKSFGVSGTVNSGQPDWASYNLLLNKRTGKISN